MLVAFKLYDWNAQEMYFISQPHMCIGGVQILSMCIMETKYKTAFLLSTCPVLAPPLFFYPLLTC